MSTDSEKCPCNPCTCKGDPEISKKYKYDYETCPCRVNTGCFKWDRWDPDVIPMWVADMDVLSPPAIIEGLQKRVSHGIFGYGHETKELIDITVKWMKRIHDWDIKPEWLVFVPGIVSGFNIFIRAIGEPNDEHLCNTPCYPPFFQAPENNKQIFVNVPLICDKDTHKFYIDFEALEKAVTPKTRSLILCHPHNPTGRDWTAEELSKIQDFIEKHNLYIASDEIWAEFELSTKHIPFGKIGTKVEDKTVTFMAPSKTFNVAGLSCSVAIIPNEDLRKKFNSAMNGIVPHANCLGLCAMEIAFGGECDDWLKGLLDHLRANLDIVEKTLEKMPKIKWCRPEATYLVWIDVRDAFPEGVDEKNLDEYLAKEHRLGISDGAGYGAPGWIRFNIGCPTKRLVEAMKRFENAFFKSSQI